jgi:predicted nucleic acid-binding protein
MRVIADATLLHYLILLGQVDILAVLFGAIIVPQVIRTELHHPQTPPAVRDWMAAPPAWLTLLSPQTSPLAALSHLGAGERDAILLAEELQADLLVVDDQQGRHAAHQRGVPIMGTLGVLERAAQRGLLDLATVLTQLQATNFRVHPALIQSLLDRETTRRAAQDAPDDPPAA